MDLIFLFYIAFVLEQNSIVLSASNFTLSFYFEWSMKNFRIYTELSVKFIQHHGIARTFTYLIHVKCVNKYKNDLFKNVEGMRLSGKITCAYIGTLPMALENVKLLTLFFDTIA